MRSDQFAILADKAFIERRERRIAFFKRVRKFVKDQSHEFSEELLAHAGFRLNPLQLGRSWNPNFLRFERLYSNELQHHINRLTLSSNSRITAKLEFNGHLVFKIVDANVSEIVDPNVGETNLTIRVMLCGRDATGQNWAHILPPMAWNWSIETCEKWLFADIPIEHRNPKMITEIVEQT